MPVIWKEASMDLVSTASYLIDEYHKELADFSIGLVFRSEPGTSGGKPAVTGTSKISAQLRPYLDYDFMIWVAETFWITASESRRRACLDHALSHCAAIDGVPFLRGHDIEEFSDVMARWGLWNVELYKAKDDMVKAVQMELSLDLLEQVNKTRRRGVVAADVSKITEE